MRLFVAISLFILATNHVQAKSNAEISIAAVIFKQGMIQFKNKQYLAARESFLKAESTQFSDDSINYNLGVVNYKLGYYPSARLRFLMLTDSKKYESLAYYNLALVAFKTNQEEQAKSWLELCLASSESESLSQLAKHLIHKTQMPEKPTRIKIGSSPQKQPIVKSTSLKTLIKTFVGHNNNVTQYLAYSNQRVADSFYDIQLDSIFSPYRNFSVLTSLYFHTYNNEKNYNTSEFSVAGRYNNHSKNWSYEINTFFNKQMIDGNDYSRGSEISLGLSRYLSQYFRFSTFYKLGLISIDNAYYEHLAGYQQRWQQHLELKLRKLRFSIVYSYEKNSRKDYYINGKTLTSSFSPSIHTGEFNINYIGQKFNLALFSKTALANYPDRNILHANAQDTNNQRSVMHKSLLIHYGSQFSYKLKRQLYLIAKYYFERNYANIYHYRYNKSIYQAGVSWQY